MRKEMLFSAFVMAGAASIGATQAEAALTTVLPPVHGNEDSHDEIINTLYGAGVTATRIDDNDDQLWSGAFDATAKAIFAKQTQSFGTQGDGGYSEVFAATGYGYNVTGSGVISGDSLELARKANAASNTTISSVNANNKQGLDKLVSYVLTGEGFNTPTYLLFWEDIRGIEADGDYQDLVVELRSQGATIIPTPAAFGAGLVMLGGALLRRRSA